MKRLIICVAASLCLALPLVAQAPGPVAKIHLVKVKPGMEAQFEQVYKQHVDWHRQQNDSWAWETWQYQSGDRVGQYVVVTPGHHWKDFDERGEMGVQDDAQAQKYLRPLMESLEVWWSAAQPAMSRLPEGGMDNVAVARVTEYHVKPSRVTDFVQLITKANEALTKANWSGPVLWTRNLTGDNGVFSAIQMLPSWSDLAPPEESVIQALARELGQETAAEMGKTFLECVAHSETQIVSYRKDLSYVPDGG